MMFFFKTLKEIVDCLKAIFGDDSTKTYEVVVDNEFKPLKKGIRLKGSNAFRMVAYHPDGKMYCSKFICSCEKCLNGQFKNCILNASSLENIGTENQKTLDSCLSLEVETLENRYKLRNKP